MEQQPLGNPKRAQREVYPDLSDQAPSLTECYRQIILSAIKCGDLETVQRYIGDFPSLQDEIAQGLLNKLNPNS